MNHLTILQIALTVSVSVHTFMYAYVYCSFVTPFVWHSLPYTHDILCIFFVPLLFTHI